VDNPSLVLVFIDTGLCRKHSKRRLEMRINDLTYFMERCPAYANWLINYHNLSPMSTKYAHTNAPEFTNPFKI